MNEFLQLKLVILYLIVLVFNYRRTANNLTLPQIITVIQISISFFITLFKRQLTTFYEYLELICFILSTSHRTSTCQTLTIICFEKLLLYK